MELKVRNLLDQNAIETSLTIAGSAGTTTLNVVNTDGFTAQYAVQIGKTGEDKAEIKLLGASIPSGTTLTLATAIAFDQPADVPVYQVKFDKIIWKRSTSGTSGTASAFATSNITPDDLYSRYDDTSGVATYAYKACYLNSVLGSTSSDSDWITSSGYDFYSLANIRQRVKDKLFATNFIGEDSVIDGWINEYLEILTNKIIDVNEDYNLGSTTVSFSGTAELGTITADDFKQVRRVWFTTDGNNYYAADKMFTIDVKPNQIFNETMPFYFMYGDNVISRWPHEQAGTASILYYKLNSILEDETDTLPQSMRGYTKGFVDYCLAQAKGKEGKPGEMRDLENSAMSLAEQFKKESTPRNKSGPTNINIVESVSDDATDIWFRA